MATQNDTATTAAQLAPEENTIVEAAAVATADMAPAAATATATPTPVTTTAAASASDAEASSSHAATEPAGGFPLPSMATAENTAGAVATTNSGAASANIPLTEEEENMAERSRYWLPSGVKIGRAHV